MNPDAAPISYWQPLKGCAAELKFSPGAGEGERSDAWSACIARAAEGDAGALAEVYDGTASLVYGLARRILGDAGAAEEITEDVYIQVWRQAARYDAARGGVVRWLLTITRSRAIDRLRAGISSRTRHAPLEDASDVCDSRPEPEHAAWAGERRTLVRVALAGLSAEQRHVIELAFFGGLSHAEIADRLGAPLGTVKTRIRLGMEHLRMALGGSGLRAT